MIFMDTSNLLQLVREGNPNGVLAARILPGAECVGSMRATSDTRIKPATVLLPDRQ